MTSTATQSKGTGTAASAQISLQAKDFAAELGVNKGHEPVALQALRDLARTCVIRFGIPTRETSSLPAVLEIPDTSNLNYPPRGIEIDPRWERLHRALRLPADGCFALDGPLIIAYERDRAALQEAISGLFLDLKGAGRLQAIDPEVAITLKAYIDKVGGAVYDQKVVEQKDSSPESYRALVQAFRQLSLYFKDGPEWALVSEIEHRILRAFAEEVLEFSARDRFPDLKNKGTQPNDSLLSHLSMKWVWDKELRQWGPQLPNTRYINSSLFRLSSRALRAALKEELAPAAYTFLSDLVDARRAFERDGEVTSLKLAQEAALKKAVKKAD